MHGKVSLAISEREIKLRSMKYSEEIATKNSLTILFSLCYAGKFKLKFPCFSENGTSMKLKNSLWKPKRFPLINLFPTQLWKTSYKEQ
jgi:hypothetical protein